MSETEPLNRVGSLQSHVTCVTARFLVMHVQVRHRAARLTPPGVSSMNLPNEPNTLSANHYYWTSCARNLPIFQKQGNIQLATKHF